MTVDKHFADIIVAGTGYCDDDHDNSMGDNPRCVEITLYDTPEGGEGYGLTFEGERNKYTPSEFVINPRQYWKYQIR